MTEQVNHSLGKPITTEEIHRWGIGPFGNYALAWFAEVLNGTYTVAAAREDCLSIVRPKAPATEDAHD